MPVNLDAIGREPNHITRTGSNRFQQRGASIFAPKPDARAIAPLGRKLGGFALGTEVQIGAILRLNVNTDRRGWRQVEPDSACIHEDHVNDPSGAYRQAEDSSCFS